MKLMLNRLLIVVSAISRNIINRIGFNGKNKANNKTVLIIFQQVFGDSIIISQSLGEYAKLYPASEGYKLIMLARPSVAKFMKEVLPLPGEIDLRTVDFKRFAEDYKYYKSIVKEYYNMADIVIVPGKSFSGELFASVCTTKRRIGRVNAIPIKWPPIVKLFEKIAYTEVVYASEDDMVLQMHRKIINYLGNKGFKAMLPKLLPQDNIVEIEPYAVVCPGASTDVKCWPTNRFAEIIDYIVDKYNIDVHLCGGSDEIKFESLVYSMVKNKDRVFSHIGKTTFKEWSAIVQHAEIVVGNDSATLHMAAASNRKAVCIVGVYNKDQFFPYKVDLMLEGEILPIAVKEYMPCAWCRTRGYRAGFGNKVCKKHAKTKGTLICIEKITVDKVKKSIDALLSNKNS